MATYYVRASGGSNSNDGLSFANGWATIAYAEANIVANDEVLVCADGVHNSDTATIPFANTTTPATPIRWTGANATGVVDGTMATISGASMPSGAVISFPGTGNWVFRYLRITAGKSYCLQLFGSFTGTSSIRLINCRIDSAVSSGIYSEASSNTKSIHLIGTEIDSNGGNAISTYTVQNSLMSGLYLNCSIHDNGLHGIAFDDNTGRTEIIGCRFYRNAGSGIYTYNEFYAPVIINSIFFNNTLHGIHFNHLSTAHITLFNNIFRSNGGYGINALNTSTNQFSLCDYNCSHNNTSGDININGGVLPGENNVLSDPLFVSETIGVEDFTLQVSSPCINAGYGYNGV